jgi:hypothetical protein
VPQPTCVSFTKRTFSLILVATPFPLLTGHILLNCKPRGYRRIQFHFKYQMRNYQCALTRNLVRSMERIIGRCLAAEMYCGCWLRARICDSRVRCVTGCDYSRLERVQLRQEPRATVAYVRYRALYKAHSTFQLEGE